MTKLKDLLPLMQIYNLPEVVRHTQALVSNIPSEQDEETVSKSKQRERAVQNAAEGLGIVSQSTTQEHQLPCAFLSVPSSTMAADPCWVTANGAYCWLTEGFLCRASRISVLLPAIDLMIWSGINYAYACLQRGMLEPAGGCTNLYQLAQMDITLPSLMTLSTTDRPVEFSIWILLGRKLNTNPQTTMDLQDGQE